MWSLNWYRENSDISGSFNLSWFNVPADIVLPPIIPPVLPPSKAQLVRDDEEILKIVNVYIKAANRRRRTRRF